MRAKPMAAKRSISPSFASVATKSGSCWRPSRAKHSHRITSRIGSPVPRQAELADRVLAQPRLLHLAARGHADRVEARDDPHVPWHAEVGAARPCPLDELVRGG